MQVLVVDDEPLARRRLIALLGEMDGFQLAGEAADGRAALRMAEATQVDIVLLDVRMPIMDGMEAAVGLNRLAVPPAIIFCTAFEEHALGAFQVHAADYLIKPIRPERLRVALDKARHLRAATAGAGQAGRTHIHAHVRGDLVLIAVDQVSHLQAQDRYVVVHHRHGQVLVEESLRGLETEFAPRFLRIHRNCLVARDHIHALERQADGRLLLRLTDLETTLEVSRRNAPALRRQLRSM